MGSGRLRKQLLECSEENNLNVNFLGQFSNISLPTIINRYQIFILPSIYEGNPKTLLEAMSCGLAVIGTDVEGIKDIIKHMKNGYLCKTDSKSIRKAIEEVAGDELLRKVMGEAAREYVVQNCDIERILWMEIQFYSRILSC